MVRYSCLEKGVNVNQSRHLQGSDTGVVHHPTPEPNTALDDNGDDHNSYGGDAELQDLMVWPQKTLNALEADLGERGNHDDGEDQHA